MLDCAWMPSVGSLLWNIWKAWNNVIFKVEKRMLEGRGLEGHTNRGEDLAAARINPKHD